MTPHAKAIADAAVGDALDVLVAAAAAAPPPIANPFEVSRKLDAGDGQPDEIVDAAVEYLTRGTR